MTVLNDANAIRKGIALASAVFAGPTKVWPKVLTYRDVILATTGLVSYWRLGEASGYPQDSKGTNHANAFGGSPTYSVAGAVVGNTAIEFKGADWFVVPNSASLQFGDFPWSVEIWVRRTAINVTEIFLSKGNQFDFVWDAGNQFYIGNLSNPIAWLANPVTDFNWHHYVIVRPSAVSGATRVYKDGADATGSTIGSATASNSVPLTFGGRGTLRSLVDINLPEPQVPSYMLHGVLDEIALYNVALTPAQILAHYNAR